MDDTEKKIFKYYDKICDANSAPMPERVWLMQLSAEQIGFLMHLLCLAFQEMRNSKGRTEWEALLTPMLKCKGVTKNKIRKLLVELHTEGIIKSFKEVKGVIKATPNVKALYPEVPDDLRGA